MNVEGNFDNDGTFTCSERQVAFNGSSVQDISGSSGTTFDYIEINNSQYQV